MYLFIKNLKTYGKSMKFSFILILDTFHSIHVQPEFTEADGGVPGDLFNEHFPATDRNF